MGIDYCHYCDKYIDFDYDVEHFPVQSDGCYNNSKCVKYYEGILTDNELFRFIDTNEIEFIIRLIFKGYKLSPMNKYTLLEYHRRYIQHGNI